MSIVDQLKGYCECVEDVDENLVAEMVNVISLATCWQRESCETFLTSERREVMDLPPCADCPITFEPYYHPFQVGSFKFYLVKTEGIEETVTELKNFAYHVSDGLFHIDAEIPSCKCKQCTCGCPPTYRLLVEYTAGYDEIPDCLLPVFCNVLEVLRAKNKCDCGNDCGCENQENNVKYATGDVVSVQLETDIGQLLVETYKNQLGMISLCRGREYLWGVVV